MDTTFAIYVLVFLLWIVPALVARRIGRRKKLPYPWLWGLVLGWLGVLVVHLLPTREPMKRCPDCAEDVRKNARVCSHCGYRFRAAAA